MHIPYHSFNQPTCYKQEPGSITDEDFDEIKYLDEGNMITWWNDPEQYESPGLRSE